MLDACIVQSCHRRCRAFYINREQQIPALRMLHAPFIKMASLLPCKGTNGMGGSAVLDGVVSGAPGTMQTGCLRGALAAAVVCSRSPSVRGSANLFWLWWDRWREMCFRERVGRA